MSLRYKTERKLKRMMGRDGNWRFKGLMLAAIEGENQVGEAWPSAADRKYLADKHKDTDRDLDALHKPPEGTKERHLAESEFGEKELEDGGVRKDEFIKRALLNESITELDVLFREELLDTVAEGARPFQVAREAAQVIDVDNRKGDIPRAGDQTYAPAVAEGGEIPMDEEQFDTVSFDCVKHGQGFQITDELIDQGLVDVIEWNVQRAGRAVENAINREFLVELVDQGDSSSDRVDTGGSAATVSDVNAAAANVELNDFGPANALVHHPELKTDLFDDTNLAYANRAGSDDVISQREYNQILGLELFTMSDGTYNGAPGDDTSNTWGFDTSSDTDEIGAVVYNRNYISIQMYRDLETKDFEDPIRDLEGGNVRAQFDVNYHQPAAASTIRV